MPNKTTNSLRSRLLLAAGALALSVGLAEVVFRLLPPMGPEFVLAATTGQMDNSIFEDDVELRVILAPNVDKSGFQTNSIGVRGPKVHEKLANEQRVLTIGDSFTLGMQVSDDQTFSALLSESLGPQVTVLNAGVPGYGTEQATILMRRLAPIAEPDVVILTIYTGNDLRDNAKWATSPGLPSTPPPVVSAPPPQRSALLISLAHVSRLVSYSLMFIDLQRSSTDFRITEFKDEILPFTDSDHLNPLMPPTRAALQRFGTACRELNLRCGVALVPPAFVVHTERIARTFDAFGIAADASHIDTPQRVIKGAVPSSISTIDLTDALREGSDRDPYLIFDPHFSETGHQITAEALHPFVSTLLDTE
jgi:hypothetical protein